MGQDNGQCKDGRAPVPVCLPRRVNHNFQGSSRALKSEHACEWRLVVIVLKLQASRSADRRIEKKTHLEGKLWKVGTQQSERIGRTCAKCRKPRPSYVDTNKLLQHRWAAISSLVQATCSCNLMPQPEYKPFVEQVPFLKRREEAERLMARYKDRVPVICEKAPRSDLPALDKKKFLLPDAMIVGEFMYAVQKGLKTCATPITTEQTLYLFADKTTLTCGSWLRNVYDKYKNEDGFLYI
eukprot:2484513-Amphidinium_carterae.1